jgi:phenol hydroxylase P1 protein
LDYVVDRELLPKLPYDWRKLIGEVLLPLRYYESGAQ